MLPQPVMGAQTVREEKDLGMEGPGVHILIKIREIRVFGDRFIERFPTHTYTQHFHQRGLSNTNIACHCYKFFHRALRKFERHAPPARD